MGEDGAVAGHRRGHCCADRGRRGGGGADDDAPPVVRVAAVAVEGGARDASYWQRLVMNYSQCKTLSAVMKSLEINGI